MIGLIEYINEKRKPAGYWNEKTCREEAKKYTIKRDFRLSNATAYGISLRNGWLKEFTWLKDGNEEGHKKRRKWNEETCREESKKYKTRG